MDIPLSESQPLTPADLLGLSAEDATALVYASQLERIANSLERIAEALDDLCDMKREAEAFPK